MDEGVSEFAHMSSKGDGELPIDTLAAGESAPAQPVRDESAECLGFIAREPPAAGEAAPGQTVMAGSTETFVVSSMQGDVESENEYPWTWHLKEKDDVAAEAGPEDETQDSIHNDLRAWHLKEKDDFADDAGSEGGNMVLNAAAAAAGRNPLHTVGENEGNMNEMKLLQCCQSHTSHHIPVHGMHVNQSVCKFVTPLEGASCRKEHALASVVATLITPMKGESCRKRHTPVSGSSESPQDPRNTYAPAGRSCWDHGEITPGDVRMVPRRGTQDVQMTGGALVAISVPPGGRLPMTK